MEMSLEVLGSALLNGLWQGGVLAFAAWACLRVLPPVRAGTRYAVWYATLIAIVLIPVGSIVIRLPGTAPPVEGATALLAPEVPTAIEIVGVANDGEKSFLPIQIPSTPFPWLIGTWALGCAILLGRLAHGCLAFRRLKGNSKPPGDRASKWEARWRHHLIPGRTPRLRTSELVRIPLTAGLLDPIVVFPQALLDSLSEEEAYAIWLHEMAHVRRRDDWTKLLQRLTGALLFFNPALAWIGRRLDLERELACDEWVVSKTGRPKSYAACLCRLAELAVLRPQPTPALGVAGARKQIYRRVEMLVNREHIASKKQPWYAAAAMLLLLAGTLVALTLASPVFAVAQPAPHPAEPPAAMVAQEPPPPATAPVLVTTPAPKAVPSPPAAVQSSVEELRREMRVLADEMRRFQEEMRPALDEIRAMSERLREQVEREIRPKTEEIRELQKRLQEQAEEMRPTQEQIRKLRDSIVEIEQEYARTIEDQGRAQQDKLRAFEDAMRSYQEAMRAKELQLSEQITLQEEQQPPPAPVQQER